MSDLFKIKDRIEEATPKHSKTTKQAINSESYTSPVMITQQFKFCPNPFRVDMYKGCDFGCKYCFANSGSQKGKAGIARAKLSQVQKLFEKAFDTTEESSDVTIELLRNRVPLHCGGMSDPFQKREFEHKLTYQLIKLSNKYNYPIIFSTKQCELPDEYYSILNPELHAFQISIMGWDDAYIKKYESNTPTAAQRLNFLKILRAKGFWCSIRIQPLVDLEQGIKLVTEAGGFPSYITIEHLKIPNDDIAVKKLFLNEYNSSRFYKSPLNMRNIEIQPDIKEKNIKILKEIANKNGVLIGVGDNDLHHLSQSRCCCGVDLIGKNFTNYLKYNLTYMVTGDCEPSTLYCPKCKGTGCFYDSAFDFKEETDKYLEKHYDLILKSEHPEVFEKVFGYRKTRLF